MKKLTFVKATLMLILFVTSILWVASCGNDQKLEDNKDVAEERNNTDADDNKQEEEDDAQFLVNAAEINLEEIHLAKLAQKKGSATHVKELGKMMEDAHTKSLAALTKLAKSKMITIPTSSTDDVQDAYKELDEESGNDFDKAYTNMMVSGHKDAITSFEKASTDSYDTDIKNWATVSLPSLRTHLEHAIESQKKTADMYFEKNN
jgi:putative membrane protein